MITFLISLIIHLCSSQPYDTACGTSSAAYYQMIQTDTISGLGSTAASTSNYILLQPTLTSDSTTYIFDGLDTFQVSLWFRPLTKHTNPSNSSEETKPEQALFRITMDTSDETLSTTQGVRLGMYYTADYTQTTQFLIRYAKTSSNYVTYSSTFQYIEEMWCFGSAGISYSKGKVSYYAFQPYSPTLLINPQPITEALNFHTALTSDAIMQIFYWGSSYQYHYGDIQKISIITGYIELNYKHNWFHLMFQDDSYAVSLSSRYRIEEMTGQIVYNRLNMTQYGYLGTDSTTETSDPTWGSTTGYLQFVSAQTVKLPAVQYGSTNTIFGIAFWFKVNAVLSGDADSVDLTKDLCVFQKKYQGVTEVLTLLFYSANSAQFGTKLKIGTTIFTPSTIVHNSNVWHHMTINVLYPTTLTQQAQILYDITLEQGVYVSHQSTGLSSTYQESSTDVITLGSSANLFSSGNLQLSNINFYNKYTIYVDEDGTDTTYLNCNNDCQVSLNSMSSQICLICKTGYLMDEGNCVASCSTGPNALSNAASTVQLCRSCDFKCSSCDNTNACSSCNSGWYLIEPAANACVTSANCGGNYVGNPTTSLCTLCGNGKRDTGETCDEGNLILATPTTSSVGCVNCLVNSPMYKCSGGSATTADTCYLSCGDGVLDSGEVCDDGNNIDGDGCSADCSYIDPLYSCDSLQTPPCTLNCGNGTLQSTSPDLEECDDGNTVDDDGCSSCKIDKGFECVNTTGNNPVSVCTKLCGNGLLDTGEDCDDGNTTDADGCSDCVVDSGWACSGAPSVCTRTCGNGVRDSGEECDDGNTISNDGCTNCVVDTDYICTGGSTTTQDKCTAIPDICGDGILKSTEECDDGNTISGDGCSKICKIEIGYTCPNNKCQTICGDGLKIANEDCDDGNILGGDGCSELCIVEALYTCSGGSSTGKDTCTFTCGDGTRNNFEDCDDGNTDSGDGCSSLCAIESGYGCITQSLSHDVCFICITNCAICLTSTTCDVCYTGFYELGTKCYPGCPPGYFAEDNQCSECIENCSQCTTSTNCLRCDYNHYLQNSKCYSTCPTGYYDKPNALSGNECISCTSPCSSCDSSTCYSCSDTYYLDEKTSTCISCNMGDNCLKCDDSEGRCLSCVEGYYRSDKTCLEIPLKCGDGLHNLSEQCDDGNNTPLDGCDEECKIELNWDCILYDNQGPDICYELAPPEVTIEWSKVYPNIIYLSFSRPMKEGIDFQSLTEIIIPAFESLKFKEFDEVNDEGIIIQHNKSNAFIPFEFSVSQFSNQTIKIIFEYQLTVQNQIAQITFINASLIQDIYNWSLINSTSEDNTRILVTTTSSINDTNFTATADIPYFIFYTNTEKTISLIVAWALLVICIIGVLSGFYYYYRIGEGRIRKTIEFVQIISMLRYIDIRMGYNLEKVFTILDYFNFTFIPSIFTVINSSSDQFNVKPKFQYYEYSTLALEEGLGRFLTISAVILIIMGINELLYRFVPDPNVEYYTEQVHKYFRCQAWTIVVEILFMDLVLSIILNLAYMDNQNLYGILNFIICILVSITIIFLFVLIILKLIKNPHIIRVQTVFQYFGEFFDGLLLTTPYTKFFALVPYIQKIFIALILVLLSSYYQIGLLVLVRLIFYSLATNIIPIFYIQLFIREVAYDCSIVIITLIILALSDDSSSKEQKLDTGWAISSLILFTIILQIFWVKYAISIIDRMIPPEIPEHEEIQQQEQDINNKDIHILQQAVEMEKMENNFFG